MRTAAVLTVSDSCAHGHREDVSGRKLVEALEQLGFNILAHRVVPDDEHQIVSSLIDLSGRARLVVTTGGTGIAPRDVTPEATRKVCDRLLAGFAELMRTEGMKQTPRAVLSRAVSGTRGSTLIVNVPGSPQGALTSFNAIAHLLPHALDLLEGNTTHSEQD